MTNKNIKIESLSKNYSDIYGHTTQLFKNISFNVEIGKLTTLLAPKGTGKSTLLKMIAGFDENNGLKEKRIFIPQKPSSFPWLNVSENILFNLNNVDIQIFKNILSFVGLDGYEDHFPNNGSIGFRFRISLARAIINKPELILIDESISELPIKRKYEIYSLLRKVTSEMGIPILYSTSSVSEALRLSDKIIVINQFPSKSVIEKEILINEESRIDYQKYFNILEYFSNDEITLLSNNFL
ncbi:MAG: ATP-binding cassette domain-containing protein [Bacteroidetes bacterium]|nr:ATP-binding cassette domain-containing protein [Bacteroidota bacterium]MBU1116123.1 ATP-binding cassette domain-containing protein [Bacteroidota bacterium]MBU1800415.1 ATP-binding cassette domain-containing protein [Bacteroidota bacterium]